MDRDELVERYPRLYHMAAGNSWPSIRKNGLLSTTALLDLFEVGEPERSTIESAQRPEPIELHHPEHGYAVVRDNRPLSESRLASCLGDGLLPIDWYRILNRRVFFWPTRKRVDTLLGAAAYRESPQVVLTVDTERLVAAHQAEITLSPLNSGATRPFAWPRGKATFRSINDFDYDERRHRGAAAIAELAVDYSVPDAKSVVVSVVRHRTDGSEELLWPAG